MAVQYSTCVLRAGLAGRVQMRGDQIVSACRSVLPLTSQGMAGATTNARGTLYGASRAAQYARSVAVPRRRIARHDHRDELFAAERTRHPKDVGRRERRHRAQAPSDLLGLDLAPGDVDERRHAPGQHECSRSIERAEIACEVPCSSKPPSVSESREAYWRATA